jgi:hypothetical protein
MQDDERDVKQPVAEREKQPRGSREGDQRSGNSGSGNGDRPPSRKEVVCHHCGKPGHIRPECPERSEQKASVCFNCKKEGHKVADCKEPRKVCKWWPDCPNRSCAYYHPPSHSPPRRSRSPDRSRQSKRRSRDRSPPQDGDRVLRKKVEQQSIRVTGLSRWLESGELGRLFPLTEIVAGSMIDEHAAVVIFKDERERDEALQTANKMIFERL